jgi:hypothetical protein
LIARLTVTCVTDAVAIGVRLFDGRDRIEILFLRITLRLFGVTARGWFRGHRSDVGRQRDRRVLDCRTVVEPIEHAVAISVDCALLDPESNRERRVLDQRYVQVPIDARHFAQVVDDVDVCEAELAATGRHFDAIRRCRVECCAIALEPHDVKLRPKVASKPFAEHANVAGVCRDVLFDVALGIDLIDADLGREARFEDAGAAR